MADTNTSRFMPGGRFFVIAGWCTLFVLVAAVMWQKGVESSKIDDSRDHLVVATLIESAEADGVAAGVLLQQYVATGDEALLPEMQAKTDSGVRTLTEAITAAGGDPDNFVSQGSLLVQASGQIIAMRQAGEVAAAGEALAGLAEQFNLFLAAQDEFVAGERAAAIEATADADTAQTTALILLVVASIVGVTMVFATAVLVSRKIGRRSVTPMSGEPAA